MNRSIARGSMTVNASGYPKRILDIVGTGWQLYWSNFYRYGAIALQGTLWIFFPTLLLTLLLLWMLTQRMHFSDVSGLSALLIPAWLLLFFWCRAQALGYFAGISRLAYQSLSSGQGETLEVPAYSLRYTRSRRFTLLGAWVIQGVLLSMVIAAFLLAAFLSVGMSFAGLGMLPGSDPSVSLFFLGGASLLVATAIGGGLYAWLALRMVMAQQVLAVEPRVGAIASVGRSWQLTRQQLIRTACVAMLAFFISSPVVLMVWLTAQGVSYMTLQQFGITLAGSEVSSIDLLPLTVAYLIGILVGELGGVVTQPFFRSVFTTLYTDLQSREDTLQS